MASTNLYPPIISTTMPTFLNTSTCKVYFAISNYNTISEIANAQVVVNNQSTNSSVLKSSLYPSGIKIASVYEDSSVEDDAKYYIKIEASDLSLGKFEVNQYYKVQIRFTSVNAPTITSSVGIASWLTNNQDYFSEWSTVCLIRGISTPVFSFTGLSTTTVAEMTSEIITFSGTMSFSDTTEKEYLYSYNIKIYNGSTLVTESGIQYTGDYNPNEINYTLNYILSTSITYTATIEYTTNGGYTGSISYKFIIEIDTSGDIEAVFDVETDVDNGRNVVEITGVFYGQMILKRASSETNFTVWETIDDAVTISSSYSAEGLVISVNGSTLTISGADSVVVDTVELPSAFSSAARTRVVKIVDDELMAYLISDSTLGIGYKISYTFYDYTIESGVYYKYALQLLQDNVYTNMFYSDQIMGVLDDAFLTRADMQLRIRYNPKVTNFKRTLMENLTQTIGSQYPYIRRNGAVNYRQFSLSGLITGFCDDEGIFLSRETIYGDYATSYEEYNEDNKIDETNDFVYERKFREKIMDFLYSNDVKLFRSTTEGNILVRLMDISLTPEETLGRMLYSFTATAYEIDDCSIDNYQTYGIM